MTILTKNSKIAIIITAAGSSTRMGGGTKKEYLPLNNGTVLSNCAISFLKALTPQYLIITYPKSGREDSQKALNCDLQFCELYNIAKKSGLLLDFVEGGKSRQSSVFNALKFLNEKENKPDYVLIHDGARPFVTPNLVTSVVNATIEYGSSVPGLTPVDTQKEIDESGFIVRHLVRSKLTAVQTPQGFEFSKLFNAHEKALLDNIEYTDDTEIWGKYVGKVKVVEGESTNKKITFSGDI